MTITYRYFIANDAQIMTNMQGRSIEECPDTGPFEPNFWHSPGFEGGKNIFIAEKGEEIVGYAAIMSAYYANTIEARVFWIDLRTDLEIDPDLAIKDTLLEKIIERGREMKTEENRDRAAVGATYFADGTNSIEYLKSHGFNHFESMLAMGVNFPVEIPAFEIDPQIEIKPWRMETHPEKEAYLAAREAAFGYPLQTVEILEHFTESEQWQNGVMYTAFVDEEIVGSCMALGDGMLDYVFVVPEWRGRGIAKKVVAESLRFLQAREHKQAWLEVYSHNEAAIKLYQGFWFEIFKEEISLGMLLD